MCGQGHEQSRHVASILLLLFKQRLKHQHAFVLRMFQIRNLSLKLQLSARSRREKVVNAIPVIIHFVRRLLDRPLVNKVS